MSFIEHDVLEGFSRGSLEEKIATVRKEARKALKTKKLWEVATHKDHAIMVDADQVFYRVNLLEKDGKITCGEIEKLKVPVVEDVEAWLAQEMHHMAEDLVDDVDVKDLRNRLHNIIRFVKPGTPFWMPEIVQKIHESQDAKAPWVSFVTENGEKIKKFLESDLRLPKTRYSSLSKEKLVEYEGEIRDSVHRCVKRVGDIVDDSGKMVFDPDQGTLAVIRDSLIGEARKIESLLGRAERLMLKENLVEMADVHDKLAERFRNMAAVVEYLKSTTH